MFGLSPQVTNIAVILFMMQAAKQVPFENPLVLNAVRVLYIVSNIIIASIYFYVGTQIKKKNDMTTLKYVEPPSPFSGEEEKLETTTIRGYDEKQLKGLYKSIFTGVAMVGVMHLYMKYTNPLLIQSIMPLKSALEGNLIKIHLWGQPAVGDLKRPFKSTGFMGQGAGDTKTDKKAIADAEKKSRGGAKEE